MPGHREPHRAAPTEDQTETTAEHADSRHERYLADFMTAQEPLRAYLATLVRDWSTVEDLLQELALVLWRSYDRYDPARPFLPWARGIAAKTCADWYRQRRFNEVLVPPPVIAAMTAIADDRPTMHGVALDALRACREELAPTARSMLQRHYEATDSLTRIAQATGRTQAAVAKILSRARRQLADCIRARLLAAGD